MKKPLLLLSIILVGLCCSTDQENTRIQIVVQPVIEKNTTNSYKILFKGLTNRESIRFQEVEGITLNDSPSVNIVQLGGEDYLEYYTYMTASKTGILKLPQIRAIINREEVTSMTNTIEVVERIEKIKPSDIVLELVSNKKQYALEDTITLSLYEYSKFYNIRKKTIQQDSVQRVSPTTENISAPSTGLYAISGVKNLDKYIESKFEVVRFDWDPFTQTGLRKEFQRESYIKSLVFELKLLAKTKANYTIPASEFMYHVYKSETDLSSGPGLNADGSASVKKEMDNKIHVMSEELRFVVQ